MSLWKIDPSHSQVTFKVKHLVVSTVSGQFTAFDAAIESTDGDFTDARISFEAEVASISTGNEQRDSHLRSADFFDAARHPKMTFASTSVRKVSDHELAVTGMLTLRGVTKEVTLAVMYNGTVAGFGGVQVAGFEVSARINRFDYGLQWNALTEAGGVVVSNDVRIDITAEFTRSLEQTKAA